jgi:predicted DNA-binding protein
MRTTIELKNEHRAKLLALAARRREKGFSNIVAEAIEAFLRSVDADESVRADALRQRGSLAPDEAERLRDHAAALRETWR